MTRTLFALSVAALIASTAASAATTVPATPAPVGACKTDQALETQCTTMWNTCWSEARDKAICRGNWGNCCHHRAILHWRR